MPDYTSGIPTVTVSPSNTTVTLNGRVELSCELTNVQGFIWRKDGRELPNTQDSTHFVIEEISPPDQGYYSCVGVSNDGETIETDRALVKIIGAIRFDMTNC